MTLTAYSTRMAANKALVEATAGIIFLTTDKTRDKSRSFASIEKRLALLMLCYKT
jgi:hypothetical protein